MDIQQYQHYRTAGRALNDKIIAAFVDQSIVDQAAQVLEIERQEGKLLLDSQDDLTVLMDYAFYEIRQEGKNLVERYQAEQGGDNPAERDLLAAMAGARTGLFKVESVSSERYNVELRELVGDRKVTLTDINFSQTMSPGLIVFFRPITVAEFTMTSGIAFIFPEEAGQNLAAQWVEGDEAERYARFFKLSKSKGLATEFV